MRYIFADTLEKIAKKDSKIVFMTGDLGFHAFERLRDNLGERFINAGVAEHNMVTAAAGMAYAGLKPWIYSVAPFVSIKVLEEILNDVCIPDHNVKIVGLGGGFDYGIAGPTHHAVNDVGIMMSLANMKVYTPGFIEDVSVMMKKMQENKGPAYLRLTKAEKLDIGVSPYAPLRRVIAGKKVVVICLGSIINRLLPAIMHFKNKDMIDLWLVSELPFALVKELVRSIQKSKAVVVIEEHVKTGGLGHYVSHLLHERRIKIERLVHLHVKGYLSHRYGSRDFHLKESGLDKESIAKTIGRLI